MLKLMLKNLLENFLSGALLYMIDTPLKYAYFQLQNLRHRLSCSLKVKQKL